MRSDWRIWAFAAVGLNSLCWGLFLLRNPVPTSLLDAEDAANARGEFHFNTAAPYLIAGRHVTVGGFHGSESPAVELYQYTSLPGLLLGGLMDVLVWNLVTVLGRSEWLLASSLRRSWVTASALYVGTSMWWALFAAGIARFARWRRSRTSGVTRELAS
jgi:hypothetical protein